MSFKLVLLFFVGFTALVGATQHENPDEQLKKLEFAVEDPEKDTETVPEETAPCKFIHNLLLKI
jgi:hypothetical protein